MSWYHLINWNYRCSHRDHETGRRCWRAWTWDGFCGHHNESCWAGCAPQT